MKNRRKHLDAALAQLQFLLQVRLDGVLDLGAPDVLPHPADFFAQAQGAAIVEADELAAGLGVDLRHRKALGVAGPLVGEDEQVSAILDGDRLLFRALCGLDVDAQLGLDALLVVDLLDAHEGVVGRALGRGTGHHDLLDQLQLEGPHRVESVDQVVRVAVRGGVAQGAQRVEGPDGLLGLCRWNRRSGARR